MATTTTTTPASNADYWCEERMAIALESLYQIDQLAGMLMQRTEHGDTGSLQFASLPMAKAIAELAGNAISAIHDEQETIRNMTLKLGKGGGA
ncbi:hypothetical protein [Brachymonas denitrificans]|uniref:hypothetical protein n=1 Tax=Brachymonas denitrificans TaxID=28220 RepID=UPI002AFE84BC|nr:hypothetical protein [Brachymonas denitrificans]